MRWLRGGVSLLLRTVVLLLVIEGVLRLLGVNPEIPLVNPEGPFLVDPDLKWRMKPAFRGHWSGVSFYTNSLGFRDDEVVAAKPISEFRIVALGGSITAGYGIEQGEVYVAQLQDLLTRTQMTPVRMINLAVPGYALFQQEILLGQLGLDLSPNLLLVDFSLNDVVEKRLNLRKRGGRGEFRGGGAFFRFQGGPEKSPHAWERMQLFLHDLPRYSAIFKGVNHMRVKLLSKKMGTEELRTERQMIRELFQTPPSPAVEMDWQETFQDLRRIVALARAHSVQIVVLTFPVREQVAEPQGLEAPQERIARFCQLEGIDFIDLLPFFRKKIQEGLSMNLLFQDDEHPTLTGHNLTAVALQSVLREKIVRAPELTQEPDISTAMESLE